MHADEKWLKYAREVLQAPPDLLSCCDGGVPSNSSDPAYAARIRRWPGYIGKRYAIGRVLLVGAIHNPAKLFQAIGNDLEQEVRNWLVEEPSARSNGRYLDAVRRSYTAAYRKWAKFTVWRNFERLLGYCKLRFDEVAFTNLAKCYLEPQRPQGKRVGYTEFVCRCNSHYPINALCGAIKPALVLIASEAKKITEMTPIKVDTESSLPLVYRFVNAGPKHGQRNGKPIEQWGPIAAQHYRNALGR